MFAFCCLLLFASQYISSSFVFLNFFILPKVNVSLSISLNEKLPYLFKEEKKSSQIFVWILFWLGCHKMDTCDLGVVQTVGTCNEKK